MDASGTAAGARQALRNAENDWVVGKSEGAGGDDGEGEDKSTQFKQAVEMLKQRGVFGKVKSEELRTMKSGGTRQRLGSQFSVSMAMLAKLGIFDAPSDTPTPGGSGRKIQPISEDAEEEYADDGQAVAQTEFAEGADALGQEFFVMPEGEAGLDEPTQAPAHASAPAAVSTPPPQSNVSKWEPIGVEAVSFICFENDSQTVTMPMWAPGASGNLQVGMVVLAWEGLVTWGPTSTDPFLIPYENMVMWTLELEDAALDITMEGTFDPNQRKLQLLTGQVIDLRVCLPTPTASFELYKSLQEVCTRVGKEKRAQLDKQALERTKQMADRVKQLALGGMSSRQRRQSLGSGADCPIDSMPDMGDAVSQAMLLKQAKTQLTRGVQ